MKFYILQQWAEDGLRGSFFSHGDTLLLRDDVTGCRRHHGAKPAPRHQPLDTFEREFEALINNEPGDGLVLAY